jgi:hypothetical protein
VPVTPRRRRSIARTQVLACVLALLMLALPAHGGGPVLHEYFEPDPTEDLVFKATASGDLPAAIETHSGVVGAPDATRAPADREMAYGGASTPDAADASYQIDRDTTRPDLVEYDDPFIPRVTPFKRLYAYDQVDKDLELVVGSRLLRRLPIGGSVQAGDDQFYGSMVVDLAADTPVRIPSVGPGARVLKAHTDLPTSFELLQDGAENWFIRAPDRKRVRLVVLLAIQRTVFGSPFKDVEWSVLAREVPPLPQPARDAALEVAAQIGIARALGPRAALAKLVAHFRAFAPSSDRPTSSGLALYKDLALTQKGVCRHRAYAFVITAHALGLPARMVRNEAHAWVEVSDGSLWHRIDLGGAAGDLESQQDPTLAQHQPPEDPFSWPAGSESGAELAARAQTGPGSDGEGGSQSGAAPSQGPLGPPIPSARAAEDESRPAAELSVKIEDSEVRRGEPLKVSGRVMADGKGCARVRVDFGLKNSGRVTQIQSMSSDEQGRYSGVIVVPLGIEVGDYELVVSTEGDSRCGSGSVE